MTRTVTDGSVNVTVELFGRARSVAGIREIEVALPAAAGCGELARALSSALPQLGGVAIEEDGSDLLNSYTANLNGVRFMTDEATQVAESDHIFVFSSQAGG